MTPPPVYPTARTNDGHPIAVGQSLWYFSWRECRVYHLSVSAVAWDIYGPPDAIRVSCGSLSVSPADLFACERKVREVQLTWIRQRLEAQRLSLAPLEAEEKLAVARLAELEAKA